MGRREMAWLLVLAAIWGTAFMFISLGFRHFSPILLAALRFDVAAVVLFALVVARPKDRWVPQGAREWTGVLVAGLLMTGAYHGFLFWGQERTTASIAAVIVGLSPVLTTVFSRVLLSDDRVGARGLLGLASGFLGIVVLAALKGGSLLDARGVGELVVMAAIASWALGSVLVKRAGGSLGLLPFVAWQSLVGAVALHAAALALEGTGRTSWNVESVATLAYLAIASSVLGILIYFRLIRAVGPIRVNLVSYIAPVFATVAGFLVLDNPLEWRAVAAFVLIAAGFWLVARPGPAGQAPALREPEDARRVAP